MCSLSALHYFVITLTSKWIRITIIKNAALSNSSGWIAEIWTLKVGELIGKEECLLNYDVRSGDRSLSYRFGMISIQTIRMSCIRGLLGTIYRYLGQSHVLGEAEKALWSVLFRLCTFGSDHLQAKFGRDEWDFIYGLTSCPKRTILFRRR